MLNKQNLLFVGCALIFLLSLLPKVILNAEIAKKPPCDSPIYCYGKFLHTLQMAKIFEDSKTVVDMKMKFNQNETLYTFEEFMEKYKNNPTRYQVRKFVNDNFEEAGQEFQQWIPGDWTDNPKFVHKIQDDLLKRFALDINHIWKVLGRKIKPEIQYDAEYYSIIWVPHPVIVPGGRFRELYYWDTYWIIKGLLLSEMYDTANGILENYVYIIDNYGHIPNGGRIYYLGRSQPPLFIPMVKDYVDKTGNTTFVKQFITTMENEFDYWMKKHTVNVTLNGKNYTLGVYGDFTSGPRPESYSEDVESAELYPDNAKKEEFYSELKAGAESGWDFSSRWFITNATNKGNLTNIKTRSIVPVDLNAMLYWNAVILSEFNLNVLKNKSRAEYYDEIAKKWLEAVEAVLWHEEVGAWLDFDLLNQVKRDYFYPTNISPLWTGCYNKSNIDSITRHVLKYLQNKNVMLPGGIPTTLEHTGEQWDFPNVWPPLQHIMIEGLRMTGNEAAQRLAYEIAEKWVRGNYKAFNETEAMYEKYDATVLGGHGGGGEYEIQKGFGWTNGVILDLLNTYGDTIRVEDAPIITDDITVVSPLSSAAEKSSVSYSQISTVLIGLIISASAAVLGVYIYKKRVDQRENESTKMSTSRTKYTELRNMPKRSRNRR